MRVLFVDRANILIILLNLMLYLIVVVDTLLITKFFQFIVTFHNTQGRPAFYQNRMKLNKAAA